MQEYTLERIIRSNTATLGRLIDEAGKHLAYSLENPWLNNHPNISCIPAGRYLCKKDTTGKYQYWKILNVPERVAIEVHPGNLERHTEGCILFGSAWSFMYDSKNKKPYPELAVTSSGDTLKKLKEILPDEYYLNIINEV